MHLIHGSAIVQCWLGLEHRHRAQSRTMLWLSALCMVKKNCQTSKYFISAFPHGLPFFWFVEPPDSSKHLSSNVTPKACLSRVFSLGFDVL